MRVLCKNTNTQLPHRRLLIPGTLARGGWSHVGVFEASLQRLDALVHEVADDVQGAPPRGAAHGELVVHVVAFELQVVHVASQLLEKRLLLQNPQPRPRKSHHGKNNRSPRGVESVQQP